MNTRSPTLKFEISEPTCVIIPAGSCPSLIDGCPYFPNTFSTSEPQIPQARILTSISPGPTGGFSIFLISMLELFFTIAAFMDIFHQ